MLETFGVSNLETFGGFELGFLRTKFPKKPKALRMEAMQKMCKLKVG